MLGLWVVLIALALLPLLRRSPRPAPPSPLTSDELVKDPVCGTYIVRSRAVRRPAAEGLRYFCSAECAGRYAG
jgi:YHS domain-containing protein